VLPVETTQVLKAMKKEKKGEKTRLNKYGFE
jgi:hypothetical protein